MRGSKFLSSIGIFPASPKNFHPARGAVFIEAALSFVLISIICFGGFELIVNFNQRLALEDVLRRSTMSIQKIYTMPEDPTLCSQAIALIEESMEESGISPEAFTVTACPITIGDPSVSNEPATAALELSIHGINSSTWIPIQTHVSSISVMQDAITYKQQSLLCVGVETVCS